VAAPRLCRPPALTVPTARSGAAASITRAPASGDFRQSEATPLPPALRRRFDTEPRWIDLRPYREGASARDARFADLAADFAAAIHGVLKEDLLSQEVRQQAPRLAARPSSGRRFRQAEPAPPIEHAIDSVVPGADR
jgi:hypothetical protein